MLLLVAGAAAAMPLPPSSVEHWYSSGLYLRFQPPMTAAANRVPVALLDLLIVVVLGAWIATAVQDARSGRGAMRALGRVAVRTLVWSAGLYLLFLAAWGLNYRRVRLIDKLPYDPSKVTAGAARDAAITTVGRLNALHDGAHAAGWDAPWTADSALAAAFDRARRDAGVARAIVVGRPKPTLLDPYFRIAGVDGMTDPFFLETLVVRTALPFERPFIVAHEWSHLAGIADEGDANFVGWLATMRGSIGDQYSGWLFLYGELSRAVPARDRAAIIAALEAGPRADLQAIRDRFAREVRPRIANAGWRVYDSYLKANRVSAGAASYAEVIRLVLGVRLPGGPIVPPPDVP
jgi:hypothetical protein